MSRDPQDAARASPASASPRDAARGYAVRSARARATDLPETPGSRPRGGTTPRAATGVAIIAASMLPAAAALMMAIIAGVDPSPVIRLLIAATVYAPVAAVALAYRRADIAAIAGSLAVTSGWFALLLLLNRYDGDNSTLATGLIVVAHVSRLPEVAALSLIPWLLARDEAHRHRIGVAFGIAPVALSAALSLTGTTLGTPSWLILTPLVWAIVSFVAGAIALTRIQRAVDPREREALRWFTAGVALLVLSYGRVLAPLTPAVALLADAAFVLAQALLPIGILAAVIPRGSPPPRTRTIAAIAWVQALAFGASAYLAATGLATAAQVDPLLSGAVSAAALALVLGATSRVTRRRIGRLFAERTLDAREVLARLGDQLSNEDAGVHAIATALRETWHLSSVEIVRDSPSETVRVGTTASFRLDATLVSGGRRIGELALTAEDAADLDTVIRPVLLQTAGLIAVVVDLASINEEVGATRQRTLDLRQQERRHLHAELHDDVAPSLAGIGFGMAGADALLARQDPSATAAVGVIRDEVAATTQTVRALARTLLPTALDQGDLAGALSELARSATADGIATHVTAAGSDVLPADRQLALYLLLAEVVRVSRRSGSVSSITASVAVADHDVIVAVRIDGAADAETDVREVVDRRTRELGGRTEDGTAVIPR